METKQLQRHIKAIANYLLDSVKDKEGLEIWKRIKKFM